MSNDDRHPKLQQILAEYARAVEAGDRTSREELIRQHPDMATDLRAHFERVDVAASVGEKQEPDELIGPTVAGNDIEEAPISSIIAAALIPFIVNCAVRGSPVFRLMGISVRRRDGDSAGRLRCGVRALVAWFPISTLGTLRGGLMTNPQHESRSKSSGKAIVSLLLGITAMG